MSTERLKRPNTDQFQTGKINSQNTKKKTKNVFLPKSSKHCHLQIVVFMLKQRKVPKKKQPWQPNPNGMSVNQSKTRITTPEPCRMFNPGSITTLKGG